MWIELCEEKWYCWLRFANLPTNDKKRTGNRLCSLAILHVKCESFFSPPPVASTSMHSFDFPYIFYTPKSASVKWTTLFETVVHWARRSAFTPFSNLQSNIGSFILSACVAARDAAIQIIQHCLSTFDKNGSHWLFPGVSIQYFLWTFPVQWTRKR